MARILVNLGTACGARGDAGKQRDLCERALGILEVHYGPDHTEVAIALANLGTAYGDLGNPHKQRDLLEGALKIKEKHYGHDHYELATTLTNLGNAYGDLGDPHKQRDLLQRALKIEEAYYGPHQYHVGVTLANLSNAYGALGDMLQKRNLLERALKILEAHYGPNHPKVAIVLVNLGTAYGTLGDRTKQRDLLEYALKIQEAYYGLNHYHVALTLTNLGTAYGALGDPFKQRDLLERALKIKEAYYALDHSELVITLTNLAITYSQLRQRPSALKMAQRVYYILLKDPLYGTNHPQTKQIIQLLCFACGFVLTDLQSSCVSVENDDEEVKTSATNHKMPIAGIFNLYQRAGSCLAQGNIDEAIKLYEAALSAPMGSIVLHNLACAYHVRHRQKQDKNDWLQAYKLFNQAIQLNPQLNTYVEYAQFLYLKGLEQPEKDLIKKSIAQLIEVSSAEEDEDLSYSWTERETVITCLRSFLATPADSFEISSQLIARYLLVSCYCHLNQQLKAQAALEELEVIVKTQMTEIAKRLLAVAKAEYASHQGQQLNFNDTAEAKMSATDPKASTVGIFNLYSKAVLYLTQGNLDKAIEILEKLETLPSVRSSILKVTLHNLACAYHLRSRQKQDANDWLKAQQTFEKAAQLNPAASTYSEYGQFLYLKGLEQSEEKWFEQAITQLLEALIAEEEGDLFYNWTDREILLPCLHSLLVTAEDSLEIKPRLLARYLLMSCYCHLNELQKAHTALGYLEKAVGMQTTPVNACLLATAKAEYAACQQQIIRLSRVSEEKVSQQDDEEDLAETLASSMQQPSSRGEELSMVEQPAESNLENANPGPLTIYCHTLQETSSQINTPFSLPASQCYTNTSSPLTSPGSPSLFAIGVQSLSEVSHAAQLSTLEVAINAEDSQASESTSADLSNS